ncbi:hypothetical protein [Effusibacillus pohliae]|uniref:hypothetical protein n=1 Tax=Effusibacillus pohliae TaxID=232270 RepID=UPI00037BCC19|nr:hypothetical protein [Effusibacillus pohliae]
MSDKHMSDKDSKRNRKQHTETMDEMLEQLLAELEKLKQENDRLRQQLQPASANLPKTVGDAERMADTGSNRTVTRHAEKQDADLADENSVPLNDYWNSLSLGYSMYDSLFLIAEPTQTWPDPLVWNIMYAAAPAGYAIPDPAFVQVLSTAVAWLLLKPTLPEQTLPYDSFLQALAQIPGEVEDEATPS